MMQTDLAKFDRPISQLFNETPRTDARLTDEQLTFFNENGYVAGIKLLNDDQLAALRSELSSLMKPEQRSNPLFYEFHLNESTEPGRRLFHALGAWRISPAFHDLLFHTAFIIPAAQLLGGPVRLWHDQIFVKPAHDGGIVAWHQDYSYWTRTKPMAHLTCWIGLDDSNRENGCVHYVPGSHTWELLPRGPLADDMDALPAQLTPEQRAAFSPVAIELKAGEASFHHPLMVHASFENRTDGARRAAVINVFRDGVVSDTDEPLLSGVPPIRKGQRIDTRFFPLLS